MLNSLYDKLQQQSPEALIIITVAIMLLSGFLMTRVTKKVHLPNVTAYILVGILIGPFCLDVIPRNLYQQMEVLADVALAFIAFSTGEFFRFSKLKKSAGKVLIITLFEALTASALVFLVSHFLLRLDVAFSVVLAALASATAPASMMMIIRQTHAKGDFVDTLLQVVAYDNLVALMGYSIALSVARSSLCGVPVRFAAIFVPVAKNLGGLVLGGVFGVFMKLLIQKKRSTDNRLIIAIALLFGFCGICAATGVSPLLGCMSMGTVYLNLSGDDKLFKQLNYFSPPILLLFFVRSGVAFNFDALLRPSGSVGGVSLLAVGVTYFGFRMIGKFLGAYLGCLCAGKPKTIRNYFGLALIPQAGVAIGLAALGARTLGGEVGMALETVILASSVLYELVGPACGKLSLYLTGSYSDKLEDLVQVEEQLPQGGRKDDVELLIERIQKIQQELAGEQISEEEHAFTEAAEEQSAHFL